MPEDDILNMTYPCIVIELMDIPFAADRQFSGWGTLPYAPEGSPAWWAPEDTSYDPQDSPYRYDNAPVAYNMDYRVSIYSRLVRDHLRQIQSRMMQYDMLTARGAYLTVPQNGTTRHLDILSGPKTSYGNQDADNNQKRFVTSTWMIRVPTEILNPITNLSPSVFARAQVINIDLSCYQQLDDITFSPLEEYVGIISAGVPLGWNTNSR